MPDITEPATDSVPVALTKTAPTVPPKRWMRTFVTFVFLAVAAGVFGYVGRMVVDMMSAVSSDIPPIENAAVEVAVLPEPDVIEAEPAEPAGSVLAEEDVILPGMLKSENFRLGDVALGGEIGLRADGDQFVPLGIAFVRGEAVPDKGRKDARVLITWKTTKAAISTLRYGKTGGTPSQIFEEEGYGVNHSAVISGLEQANTYTYLIEARDRWGNTVQSDTYAVYTGARNISLFELISGALGDIFGWAFNR